MIQIILGVYDSAVGSYIKPFFVPKVGAGSRAFQDEVNREGSDFGKHPDDFILYELGFFNDETGKFESHPDPRPVLRGKDCIAVKY